MKLNPIKGLLTLLLLSWSVTNASAGLLGLYAGASIGKAEIVDANPSQDDTATKIYAGYRFLGPLAIEVARVDMGEYYSGVIAVDGLAVDAVAYLPLGIATLFAKAGMFNWNVGYTGGLSESGTDPKIGFGIEYNLLANIDLRVEYEKFSDIGDPPSVDMTLISAGVNISF